MSSEKTLPNNRNKTYGGAWSIYDSTAIETLKLLPNVDIDPAVFLQFYKDWIAKDKNFIGWQEFEHLDFSNGTTETFDKFYHSHSQHRLRLIPGEYFYHQIQAKLLFKNRFCWIGDEPLAEGDVVVMSCPFSDTGNLPDNFDEILSECDRLSIPVLLDMAYISISNIKNLDLSYSCIKTITTSLSKVFPVEHHRIGIRLRRQFEDDTLVAYNQNQYVNKHSVNIGYHMIQSFSNSWLIDSYKNKQKEICEKLGVDPSSCVIFGIDRNNRFVEYNRGARTNRLCFSKVWDGRNI